MEQNTKILLNCHNFKWQCFSNPFPRIDFSPFTAEVFKYAGVRLRGCYDSAKTRTDSFPRFHGCSDS
ncbi:7754_t:CDS:2, partial [Dentiscutata heterogama]